MNTPRGAENGYWVYTDPMTSVIRYKRWKHAYVFRAAQYKLIIIIIIIIKKNIIIIIMKLIHEQAL